MNTIVKQILRIDRCTGVLAKVEATRTRRILKDFPFHDWLRGKGFVLNIGTGTGDLDAAISCLGNVGIYSMDLEDYRLSKHKDNISFCFFLADGNYIPIKGKSFDAALLITTLHHISSPENVLAETLRVIKPGGDLFILEDLIGAPRSLSTLVTYIHDSIVNAEFLGHPHSNKTWEQWQTLLGEYFGLTEVKNYTKKWGIFKLLRFGLFWYKKVG